jgi:hypothetical protein
VKEVGRRCCWDGVDHCCGLVVVIERWEQHRWDVSEEGMAIAVDVEVGLGRLVGMEEGGSPSQRRRQQ